MSNGIVLDLVRMLEVDVGGSANFTLAELGAFIIARLVAFDVEMLIRLLCDRISCCETAQHQQKFHEAHAIPPLLKLLQFRQHPRCQESSLEALAALSRENSALSQQISTPWVDLPSYDASTMERPIVMMLKLLRDPGRSTLRLAAASCLTNLSKTGTIPFESSSEIIVTVIPVLVKLFSSLVAFVFYFCFYFFFVFSFNS